MAEPVANLTATEVPNGGWDPRLRQFRAGDEVDTTVLITTRYVVLIDTMTTPELARDIVQALAPELATRQLLVVNTHADWDHAWGNALFAGPSSAFPAPIIGHALTRARLLAAETRDYLAERQTSEPRLASVTLVPPTITFIDTLSIDGGDLTLELIPTPGHTPDHVAVWLPELRLLLAGDAAEHPFPHIANAADLPILRASLQKLAALDPALVIPCHGGTTAPDLIARNLAYFDEVERRCQTALTANAITPGLLPAADLPAAIAFPFDEAVRMAGAEPDAIPTFYRRFHDEAIRVTLEHMVQ